MNAEEQEAVWQAQKEACYRAYILRIVAWLQIDDAGEKKRVYRQCVAEHGELVAKGAAAAVSKIKSANFGDHAKRIISELPSMCFYDAENWIRSQLRRRS